MIEDFSEKRRLQKILYSALRNILHENIESQFSHLANNIEMVFKSATKKVFKNSIIVGRVRALTLSDFAMQ